MNKIFTKYLLLSIVLTLGSYIASAQITVPLGQDKGGIKVTQSPLTDVKLISTKHNLCNGDNKGAINIAVSGGVPPYTYHWSNGSTTQDIAGLLAGTYRVKVTDSNKCSDSLTVQINQSEKLQPVLVSVTDILCFSHKKGSIDISVTGGAAPYKFSWSNGATTEDITEAPAGLYSVLVTDANNCQEILTAEIKQKALIVRSIDDVKNIKCEGESTGQVVISVSGGVPPYTYLWNNGATTKDLMNVPAGDYYVVVTDANNCMEASTTRVIEPKKLKASVREIQHIKCFGDKSGAVLVDVIGGVAPYKYKWSNGSITQDITGVAVGKYTLSIVDQNGCSTELSATVNEPPVLSASIEKLSHVTFHSGSNGAVNVSVTGGVQPYQFYWSNGAHTQNISGLKAASYSLRIVDANKCVRMLNVTVTEPRPLVVELENVKNIKCHGDKEGVVNIRVTGGVTPYAYKWSNGAAVEDIEGVPAGNYTVEVTDANGIKKTLAAVIDQPSLFTVKLESVDNILCNGDYKGEVDISATGGVSPYTYKWSNGTITEDLKNIPAGKYSVEVSDANGCTRRLEATVNESPAITLTVDAVKNILCFGEKLGAVDVTVKGGVAPYTYSWSNGATTQDISGVPAGNYSVTVTDLKGCTKTVSASVTQPELLKAEREGSKNVSCFGSSTGSINIMVAGGVKPYNFKWSNGATTQNLKDIAAGNYMVTITDANGCSSTVSTTITQPPLLVSKLDGVTNINCYGDSKGMVNISVTGGMPPYTYKWNTGEVSQDLADVKAGSYTVFIRDANGCTDSIKAVVNQNPLLVPEIVAETNIKCYGEKKGAVTIAVKGGVAPYTYKWSNGVTTQNLVDVGAGIYAVTVTDAIGCNKTVTAKIIEPSLFTAKIDEVKDIKCFSDSTGFVKISVAGGIAPYDYKWSNGATSKDLSGVKAGSYSVKITDSNGCTQNLAATITQPTVMAQTLESVTNVLCNGDKGGAVNISVIGGVPPYSYKWSNGATTQDITEVAAGKYSVLITDANGCKKSIDAVVTEPPALELALENVKHISCFGDKKGSATINVTGGVAPYTYSWSNGTKTKDISEVGAGQYTVRVTDAKGCVKILTATINQPQMLVATLDDVKNIQCFGDTTGTISITVKGGVGPYSYKWSNGATSEDIKGLVAGTYTVKITDTNGCIQNLTGTISQPAQLIRTLDGVEHVSCNGEKSGMINITVNGGVAPYTYKWSNGATTQDLSEVAAGTYSVIISDANGCKAAPLSATVNEPAVLVVKLDGVKNIQKYGDVTGAVNISVSGGVSPYKFSWSNGTTTQNLLNVASGNYECMVTDAKGCLKTIAATITQPQSLIAEITSVKNINCFGDSTGVINLNVSGGASPYIFTWSNGVTSKDLTYAKAGTYTVVISDAIGNKKQLTATITQPGSFKLKVDQVKHLTCAEAGNGKITTTVTGGKPPYSFKWNNGATTQDLINVPAGNYSVTVTDVNGCSNTENVVLEQPEPLVATVIDKTEMSCNGDNKGSIKLKVSGGVPPYNYTWSNGAKTQDVTGLFAGSYSVRITDSKGCVKHISETIAEPPVMVASLTTIKHNPCFGDRKGSVGATVTGGKAPYSFSWSTGDTTQNLKDLAAGTYILDIVDAKGCAKKLTAKIEQPELLTVTLDNVKNIKCAGENNGYIDVSVKGGLAPYSYTWSNGAATQDVYNLKPGEYTVQVKDANGCINSNIRATITEPAPLSASVETVRDILCSGEASGAVSISVTGGVSPYSYSWSNGAVSKNISGLTAGNYSVIIKDANGCVENISAPIVQPETLTVSLVSVQNINCFGNTEGSIKVNVRGGVTPYSFKWSSGETTQDISNLPAGKYTLNVLDARGCVKTLTANVTQPPMLLKTIDVVSNLRCSGDRSGAIHITVLDGVPPYKYQWSNGSTEQDLLDVPAGDYSVTITEGNGCTSTLNASINEPTMFSAKVEEVNHVLCSGDKRGAIKLAVDGGVPPYNYSWNTGATTASLSGIIAGSYSVMVTDANGCMNTLHVPVNEPSPLTLTVDSVWTVKCCGDSSGGIFISVKGGVKPYKYLWTNGKTTEDITGLKMGRYEVVVTDANGCTISTPEEGTTLYDQIISRGGFTTRNILFDVGKAIIKVESFGEITKIATLMKDHSDLRFSIEGHTDSDGEAIANQILSEARSKAIREALIKLGIDDDRLVAKGYGESKPIDTNNTKEGKANNRRVEFVLLLGGIASAEN